MALVFIIIFKKKTLSTTEFTQNTKPLDSFQHTVCIQEQLIEFHVSPVNNMLISAYIILPWFANDTHTCHNFF